MLRQAPGFSEEGHQRQIYRDLSLCLGQCSLSEEDPPRNGCVGTCEDWLNLDTPIPCRAL